MLPWANKAKLRFVPAYNSQDTGWVKTWCPSSPFPLPLFQPISWKRCISGLARSQGINAGVPFEASNHEMGLLHLCLTGKWPLNPPMVAFRTQRTVNDNQQSNAFSATSADTRMRKCAIPWGKSGRPPTKTTHKVTRGAIQCALTQRSVLGYCLSHKERESPIHTDAPFCHFVFFLI